jgi:hypothetical protein
MGGDRLAASRGGVLSWGAAGEGLEFRFQIIRVPARGGWMCAKSPGQLSQELRTRGAVLKCSFWPAGRLDGMRQVSIAR